jgi:hypothetical protein
MGKMNAHRSKFCRRPQYKHGLFKKSRPVFERNRDGLRTMVKRPSTSRFRLKCPRTVLMIHMQVSLASDLDKKKNYSENCLQMRRHSKGIRLSSVEVSSTLASISPE